ncbi:MAG: sigma-54-dependent transcriptional regulator [Cyclobacteriaceae bacterium]
MAKSKGKILIVDDDEYVLLSIKLLMEQQYETVTTTFTPQQIPALLDRHTYDAVLLDMNFRKGDTASTEGLFWLRKIKATHPETQVILMTAYGEIDLAVEAMKEGAIDFVAKPWENEKLNATVANAVALSTEKRNVKQLKSKQRTISSAIDSQYPTLVGHSASIQNILKVVDKVSGTHADVLILGENGTGKEVLARTIHRNSTRAEEVFISVDLGSLSDTLFESELFGHKKGAFTDAKEDRLGRIEAAHGGTLFLDEIGNLSAGLQSKLLSFLQSRQVVRVGTNHPVEVDVRVICATNSDLHSLVKEGQFREDLLYRINTVEITMPPLRERPEDVPMLAEYFFNLFCRKYQKQIQPLDDRVTKLLQQNPWPGNIRELQHALERAVIMNDTGVLSEVDFQNLKSAEAHPTDFDELNLEKVEAWAIRTAIKKHHGNVSHAARELGLSRGALYRRIERYGI